MAFEVLIIDDEADIRKVVAGILEDEGLVCRTAEDSKSALASLDQAPPDVIILDIWLERSQLDGMAILQHVKRRFAWIPVVMISGHGNIALAVEAIKRGAYDFIEKPFKTDRIVVTVNRAIESARLRRENAELRRSSEEPEDLIGGSHAVRKLHAALERVAPSDSRVLISGPPGSGKEVFARQLHRRSTRARNPFIVVNCAAMAPDRMESQLFGESQSGKFGAPRIGTLEAADHGTLLLDEVGDMPLATQGKIVRVLQDQTFTPAGKNFPVEVDVRVIASTSRDMEAEIAAGNFREDLYYRLNVVPIDISPLKKRRDDIPALVEHFMARAAEQSGLLKRTISEEAMLRLQAHDWPGNIRQLKNVVEWILIMAPGDPQEPVSVENLPVEVSGQSPVGPPGRLEETVLSLPLRAAREVFERHYLQAQMLRFNGNVSRTADFVDMERSALHRKLRLLGIGNRTSAGTMD